MYSLGVDLGSTTAKAVVVDGAGSVLSTRVVQMGAVSRRGAGAAIEAALTDAGLARDDIDTTIATGYGRRLVPDVDRALTEITCHARGVFALVPDLEMVIDIGGQDSKAIRVTSDGLVGNFAMNDRCASGTGRFFDVLARALDCDFAELDDLALSGSDDLEVSSMCATFAETEIISLLAEGAEPADIAASVHRSVAARTLSLVAQVRKPATAVLTGGVARSRAARHFLARALGVPISVPDEPQATGALGAALLGIDTLRGTTPLTQGFIDRGHTHDGANAAGRDCSSCSAGRARYGPLDIELWTQETSFDRRP